MTKTPYEFFARFNPDGTVAGCTVRYQIWSDGVLLKDGDPEPVNVNDAAFNSFATAFSAAAVNQLEAANTAKQQAELEKETASSQLDAANARIAELEAQLNPPNPFPNADWQGFRSAALASPVIMRMAMSNVGNFMMLLIYMTEMQKDPSAVTKMAGVWNEMEGKTALSADEIAAVNALAQAHSVPFALNDEGQIVLP